MLAADHRLRDSAAFRRTVRSGRRAGSSALVVHVRAADPDQPAEAADAARPATVGFVVSKAVGGAVVRNRVKRRLRHLARGHLAELAPGTEVVVRALPASASMTSAELEVALSRSLRRGSSQ